MIKVNLLPLSLRVSKKKKASTASSSSAAGLGQRLPLKMVAMVAGAGFIFLTLYFDFDYIRVSKKLKILNSEWIVMQPQMQSLKTLEDEVGTQLVPEQIFLNTHVLSKEPITSLLQAMSEVLPEGMWLQGFSMGNSGKDRSFRIQGIALNIENQTNIEQIESYLQKLKLIIPNSQFTYSTAKQSLERVSATSFISVYKWQAD